MRKIKNRIKHIKNPLEELIGGGLDSILGVSSSENKRRARAGDLEPGQEVSFAKLQEEQQAQEERNEKSYVEPGIDYSREIIQAQEIAVKHEGQELEIQLREIMAEIKKLTDSSKELQIQFKTVAVEQYAAKPGKYHKTFFSWLLSVIRSARMKVEDSGAWLTAIYSKKKSREYGAMAKKHGTSFTLNNERTVATQVG